MIVAPDASKQTEAIFLGVLREAVGRQRLDLLLQRVGAGGGDQSAGKAQIVTTYAFAREAAPSAVQQNVPAWLVFAIFFVAIPFSNTFVRERELGAHRRLRTTNVSAVTQFFGKLIPYFAINQLQVALMLAVGVFLVPLLGGEALQIRGSPVALILLSAAVSLAALGLALLIAVAARTTEQATMLSGLGNIVLAAVGGIMVPKFVMPAAMQDVAAWSPMAWGLDGFLDLLLRDGDTAAIAPELMKLGGFGAVALVVAWLIYRTRD
ncbi:MAG: ABC transporter permease [Alphaproteobacteria bacterium]|nr:ABC transporter permease [Alphaproteobacteria bacterium]